jgi:hypothetical protein
MRVSSPAQPQARSAGRLKPSRVAVLDGLAESGEVLDPAGPRSSRSRPVPMA